MTLTSKMRRQTSGMARLEVGVGDDLGRPGVVDEDVESAVAVHRLVDQTLGLVSSEMSACM